MNATSGDGMNPESGTAVISLTPAASKAQGPQIAIGIGGKMNFLFYIFDVVWLVIGLE